MERSERLLKKRCEAERLRDVPPERSLRMGFEMTEFIRRLSRAADHARS